jgi:hypothetical protein
LEYYCHACKIKDFVLVPSLVRANYVLPSDKSTKIPPDFLPKVIDYDEVSFDASQGEDGKHMRNVRPLEDGNFLSGKSTIVFHGKMGSGKTVGTKRLLGSVREEKENPKILAISFRKMLASMFADSFGLVNYTDAKERFLYDAHEIAIQLDSLPRLGKPIEGIPYFVCICVFIFGCNV